MICSKPSAHRIFAERASIFLFFGFLVVGVADHRTIAGPGGFSEALNTISPLVDREFPSLQSIYQNFHTHPELSFQEKETSAKVADELKQAGFEVTAQIGGYGVVGVLKNGAGPTILVRTDMDALPVKEETGLPYASKVTTRDDAGQVVDVMHACGHDSHMAIFIGTARILNALKAKWKWDPLESTCRHASLSIL